MRKYVLTFTTMIGLLMGCTYLKSIESGQTAYDPQRYVVTSIEVGTSQAKLRISEARNYVKSSVIKDLKYIDGFVANLTTEMVTELKAKHNVNVEQDKVYSLGPIFTTKPKTYSACSPKPPPPPTQPPPTPPTQPAQQTPWGIKRVYAPEAWAVTKGEGIVICDTDTGINSWHPDLKDNILGGEDFTDSGYWEDGHGHGSHTAGTIIALDNNIGVVGVAPMAKLWAMKVLDDNGSGYSSGIADGIRACITKKAHIITMSLGSADPSDVIHQAIIAAKNAGIYVVAAAGNESTKVGYPAGFPEAIAVSASNESDALAYFSNYGPEIDVIAPGTNVLSTVMNGGYASYNGTSMATPHVAGVLSLMLAAKKLNIKTIDLGLSPEKQGSGLPHAQLTVAQPLN